VVAGDVWCWGYNYYSQLGWASSVTNTSNLPLKVGLPAGAAGAVGAVTAGTYHTCALAGGVVYCWGYNGYGQLGTGDTNTAVTAVAVGGGLTGETVMALAAKAYHTCALTAAGEVWCWGSNSSGQLGNGNSGGNSLVPVAVDVSALSTFGGFVSLASGVSELCAFGADGELYCWGNGRGTPQVVDVSEPAAKGVALVAMAGGSGHWCGLSEVGGTGGVVGSGSSAGGLYCWGNNYYGQLGVNQMRGTNVAKPAVGGLPVAVDVGGAVCRVTGLTPSDEVECVTGAHDEGEVDVGVARLGVWRRQTGGFTYFDQPAVITGIEPARGPVGGGVLVTISGTGLNKNPSVTIDGVACEAVEYVSETQLRCVTPAGAAVGKVDVAVDTPTQEPSVLVAGYEYYPPFSVTAIEREWGLAAGGETVTISGENFLAGIGYEVYLGEATCSGVVAVDDGAGKVTGLTCTTGAYELATGVTEAVVDVVIDDGVMVAKLVAGYEYIGEFYLRVESSTKKVSFHLFPGRYGAVSSLSHQVIVSTNSHVGYTLSLSAAESDTDLVGATSGRRIPTGGGSVSVPVKLGRNTWGFAWAKGSGGSGVMASSGFDEVYVAEYGEANSTSVWAGVPAAGSEIVARVGNEQCKSGEVSEIFYGMNGDLSLPIDTYSQMILYTVVGN
jgi:hypothetical protein